MVSEDRIKRARSAVDELQSGEMNVVASEDGKLTVKGYEVDLTDLSCECKDHEYNERFCKHIVAARLQTMWGNIDADVPSESSEPPKPSVLDPRFENVPEPLTNMNQWVCWRQELHENKDGTQRWTKVPVDPHTGGFGSSTDDETWGSFRDAVSHYNTNEDVMGIGIVISEELDNLIGIDIDDCRDPESGMLDEAVHEILADVDTYAEVSPSGTGIRIFAVGSSSTDACEAELPEDAHIEKYVTGRYLTVTGHRLTGVPEVVRNDKETIAEFDSRCASDD